MADPTRDSGLTLLGSAATSRPEPGCRCRQCLAAAGAEQVVSALRVGSLTVIGGVLTEDGADPITVHAGEAVERAGVRVIGLPGATGVALVIGSTAGTALWAPAVGPLSETTLEALRGADLDVAALDVRSGCLADPTDFARPTDLARPPA
ncbi:MAG TPA: hypothetical protein VHN80_00880, partial [Kineosporiaceae bacterium]|nr:hypothetical protein [Kineosporiaceae bacterium]